MSTSFTLSPFEHTFEHACCSNLQEIKLVNAERSILITVNTLLLHSPVYKANYLPTIVKLAHRQDEIHRANRGSGVTSQDRHLKSPLRLLAPSTPCSDGLEEMILQLELHQAMIQIPSLKRHYHHISQMAISCRSVGNEVYKYVFMLTFSGLLVNELDSIIT